MDIPDAVFWGGAITITSALVGYVVRIESRLNERLTRDEHQRICDRSNGDLNRKLDDVRRLLEESREDRRRLHETMQLVATEVAVMRGRALHLSGSSSNREGLS
jgi:hypothetical protein